MRIGERASPDYRAEQRIADPVAVSNRTIANDAIASDVIADDTLAIHAGAVVVFFFEPFEHIAPFERQPQRQMSRQAQLAVELVERQRKLA